MISSIQGAKIAGVKSIVTTIDTVAAGHFSGSLAEQLAETVSSFSHKQKKFEISSIFKLIQLRPELLMAKSLVNQKQNSR